MPSQSRSIHPAVRAAALVVLGAFACDLGVEPPPDTPVLAVSAREVELFVTRGSDEPDEVTVGVSNNGRGTLSGLRVSNPVHLGAASGWLDATLQDTTIILVARAVTVAGATLDTGAYDASVDVIAEGAANSPRTIAVRLSVGRSQQIALSVGAVTFAATATNELPPSQTVTISNAGDGVLSLLQVESIAYRAGEPTGWLDTALLRTRAPTGLELRPTLVPSSKTKLHATVVVGSRIADPATDSVLVEYIVAPPPTLVVSTRTLALQAVDGDTLPIVRQVRLEELERRPLTGLRDSVSPNPGWLTSARDADNAPAILTVTVDPRGLVGGADYRGTVFVTSSAGDVEEIAVELRVRRGPTVHVSMDTVRFAMNPTGPVPAQQPVRIENAGLGTLADLDTAVTRPASWLTASLTGTTAPSDLVLGIDSTAASGLAPGTVDAAVVQVTGGQGPPQSVTVVFEMLPGPSIVLSADSVTFRSDAPAQDTLLPQALTVSVANGGTGILSGLTATVTGGSAWLTSAALGGTTGATTLTVRPDTVPDAGTYVDTVVVRSAVAGVDSVLLPVAFEVAQNVAPEPVIGLSSGDLLFRYVKTEPVPEVVLGVENLGTVPFRNLRVDHKPRWLTYNFVGDVTSPPTALQLTVNERELNPPFTDVVRLTASASGADPVPVELSVTLQVSGPEIVATSERVAFRAYRGQAPPPTAQVITVSNGASGTLDGIVATGPSWLDVTPGIPSSVAAPATVTMTPGTTDPSPPFVGTVYVDGGADNSPLPIAVVFEVDPGPTLRLETDTVRLSAVARSPGASTAVVHLYNAGFGDLGTLTAEWSQRRWLTATVDQSVAPARLELTATADSLDDGASDRVTIRSTVADAVDLVVVFDVAPPPEIQVSPTALVFHVNALTEEPPAAQTITVFDPAGGPSGDVAATSDAAWLDVGVDAGTAPVSVVVQPNAVLSSTASPYTATVTVTSTVGGSVPQQVPVTYSIDVGLDPVIELSRETLTFVRPTSAADTVPAQTVDISNGGSRTLRELSVTDVTADPTDPSLVAPVDWLFVLLDSRIAPATLTVAIKPAEAAATQRTEATLAIAAEDAETRYITVRLQ
jgi:hypothetical protein